MTATATATATVEVLTAEVRVLQVGSRQVTLSVYRQLDLVYPSKVEPFGRIRDRDDDPDRVYVVGRHVDDGSLVRSFCRRWYDERAVDATDLVAVPESASRYGTVQFELDDSADPDNGATRFVVECRDVFRCRAGCVECGSHNGWHWRSPGACVKAVRRAEQMREGAEAANRLAREWADLPLVVLAGLR